MGAKLTLEQFNAKLKRLHEIQPMLAGLGAEAMALRKELSEFGFFPEGYGTKNFDLGAGWTAKVDRQLDYSLDNDPSVVQNVIDSIPKYIAERLFKSKYSLSVSEYKKLDTDEFRAYKDIVDTIVTTKDKAPVVSIVPPKGK